MLRIGDPGIFLGGYGQYDSGTFIGIPQGADGNLLVAGGTGSGKSTGIAKPTLATWTGTIFAIDVKGELSAECARLYKKGLVQRPYLVFDPSDADTPSFDPFSWLEQDGETNLISNVLDLAYAIIPTPPSEPEPFWTQAEQQTLAAALLYYYLLGLSFSETACAILAQDAKELCQNLWSHGDGNVKMLVGKNDENQKLLASIDRGLRNHLSVFTADRCIAHAFRGKRERANTFTWSALETESIFLRVPQDKADIWAPALNLMIAQMIRFLERRPEQFSEQGKNLTPVLLLLDEFPRLGKLPMLTNAVATLRSKRVNIALFAQSLAQIDRIYGEHERRIIADNCRFKAILRADDVETQHYLAELIGTQTVPRRGWALHTDIYGCIAGCGWQISEQREYLIQPHELATLNDMLVLSPNGFCRINKLHPNNNLAELSSLASRATPSCTKKHVGSLLRNESATVLSPDERLANANGKCNRVFQTAHKPADAEKTIGSIVTGVFPELARLESSSEDGVSLKTKLDAVTTALASDPDLLERLCSGTMSAAVRRNA